MSGRRYKPLRCPGNTWGWAVEATGMLEVRCADRFCRTAEGEAVIHVFDLATGSFVTRAAQESIPVQAAGPEEHAHARNTTI